MAGPLAEKGKGIQGKGASEGTPEEREKENWAKVGDGIRKKRERARVFKTCANVTNGTMTMSPAVCQSCRSVVQKKQQE